MRRDMKSHPIQSSLSIESSLRHRVVRRSRHHFDDKINPYLAIAPFDETRGSLVIEYFIKHFIAMAKKSNEYRAYGQGLMYLMQAENLMKLLRECGYYGTSAHVELLADLEQLRQLNREEDECLCAYRVLRLLR